MSHNATKRKGPTELLPTEIFWRDHAAWLKECGYELRPRFRPGWVPSWTGTNKHPYEFEDSHWLFIVAMKIIRHEDNPDELAIATFLTSEEKSSDRRNHWHVIIVMLYLRPWYDPKFKTIGEGVQFFREMLEGLQFIHDNNIAHRDGEFTNIMMDASQMYRPDSFHLQERDLKYDFSSRARYRSCAERPPKYYFIDLAFRFSTNQMICRPPFPEFLADNPDWTKRTPKHDPFAVDIYYLGNAFRAFLCRGLHGMRGFQFMEPLIAAMTEPDPSKRIKIDEAVRKFALVEKGLSAIALRSRVAYNTDFTIFRPFKAFGHWVWTLGLIAQRTPAIPNPLS
ncbi:hypothetical protein DFS33DRAFT_1442824 [Desarmillaria ectypa]|nr:hypothetical protein DFS33DRAFT_1442824 [Desarmillaria ectypa]